MRITSRKMSTPITEELDNNIKVRTGTVKVSDGKTRPTPMRLHLSVELLKLQKEELTPPNHNSRPSPSDSRVRIVGVTRQKIGGLGLSIKGGAEHKLPILVSRIFKDQAADQTGQLFVGDAIIKVNGELITHCQHDEAVNILRNAGDIVMLTVKHYRAATPFLQKSVFSRKSTRTLSSENSEPRPRSDSTDPDLEGPRQLAKYTSVDDGEDDVFETYPCQKWFYGNSAEREERGLDNGTLGDDAENWKCNGSSTHSTLESRNSSTVRWVDIITVPLMMAYVTRYIFGTDKLRPNAFEVRGLNGSSTGVVHCDDAAILSQWLKYITDNIMGLTHLQMKLYNRNFPAAERIEYMGWVNEGVLNNNQPWQNYRPRFLTLKGTDVMLFDSPPLNVGDWTECGLVFKVYQSMLRVIKDSENVDERQHCFLIQTSGQESRYFSVETRQELLRIESSWHSTVCTAVIKLGSKSFNVAANGKPTGLTLDWNMGFALYDNNARSYIWQYKFSQLRGSSDDGKSKLKLHFQDSDTKGIETKELECSNLQALLFCMHAFLTAKVASVDPAFLSSRTP